MSILSSPIPCTLLKETSAGTKELEDMSNSGFSD
jgi:hypothetical protein